jgi:hypothetical protein
LKLSLLLPSDVKDLPDQILEEPASSTDMAQVVGLLLSLTQEGGSEEIPDFGNGSPTSGNDQVEDDDSMDWDLLDY